MEQRHRHPFDLIDLGLLLFVAPLHPVAFFAVLGQWFIRRSAGVAASAADALAALGIDRRLAEGRLARALLPGLAERPARQAGSPQLPAPDWECDDPLAPPAPAAAGAGGWGAESLLPLISLAELAQSPNILLVGGPGPRIAQRASGRRG